MTRATAASRQRPILALALTLAVGLVLAACGVSPEGSGESGESGAPSPSASLSEESPSARPSPPPASAQPASAAPAETSTPSPDGATGARECSGSAENRDFFLAVAEAVDWPVYCAVLPDGWLLESGNYRLRDGGHMVVAYRGPSGARLELREGAFCKDGSGCVPAGRETGTAAFGDRTGLLFDLDGGGLGLAVDRGAPISWLAIGGNLDEAGFLSLAAAFERLE